VKFVSEYTQRDPQIEVIGAVDDAIKTLATAKVAVVPLLSGAGTRLKIVEAWAAGTAVVSTTIGAPKVWNTQAEHTSLWPMDLPNLPTRLRCCFQTSRRAFRIAAAGRELYERNFTWEQAWRGLSAVGIQEHVVRTNNP
jgi:glycosyltransferase involved in cell wall biosynthesis